MINISLNSPHLWWGKTRPTPTPIFSAYSKKTCVLLILISIVIWHLQLPLTCLIHFDKWPLKKLSSYLKKFENCRSFSAFNRCLNFNQNIIHVHVEMISNMSNIIFFSFYFKKQPSKSKSQKEVSFLQK